MEESLVAEVLVAARFIFASFASANVAEQRLCGALRKQRRLSGGSAPCISRAALDNVGGLPYMPLSTKPCSNPGLEVVHYPSCQSEKL